MSDDLIAKLTALYEKATPGPWTQSGPPHRTLLDHNERPIMEAYPGGKADAALVATLVTAWPVIKARLEAAERLRDEAYYTAGTYEGNKDLMKSVDAYDLTKTERTETA